VSALARAAEEMSRGKTVRAAFASSPAPPEATVSLAAVAASDSAAAAPAATRHESENGEVLPPLFPRAAKARPPPFLPLLGGGSASDQLSHIRAAPSVGEGVRSGERGGRERKEGDEGAENAL